MEAAGRRLPEAKGGVEPPGAGRGRKESLLLPQGGRPRRHLGFPLPAPGTRGESSLLFRATWFSVICKSSHKTPTQGGHPSHLDAGRGKTDPGVGQSLRRETRNN